jgi:hypothetical protein
MKLLRLGEATAGIEANAADGRYGRGVTPRRRLSERSVRKLSERERTTGVDPDDAAARWLEENDPPPAPAEPKSARKSKTLHRWRQRQQRER